MTIRHSDSFRLAAERLYDDTGAQALECLAVHRSVAHHARDTRRAYYAGILALFVTLLLAEQREDHAGAPARQSIARP